MIDITIAPDQQALAQLAAERFIRIANQAIEQRGQFSAAVSGGSTPKALHHQLAASNRQIQIDWQATHIFWGDERGVPPDHPDSNYRMVQETLLDQIKIPADNIHRIQGELPPEQAAAVYQSELFHFFAPNNPRFDLVILGLGTDGHTASLFPHTSALNKTALWVTENQAVQLDRWRITLTAKAINAARQVIFLVSGEGKAEILKTVLEGPHLPQDYPVQRINPANGKIFWLIDEKASQQLRNI